MQDLDERLFETWDLESVLDPSDEQDRVDPRDADVLEKTADEAWVGGWVGDKDVS